MNGIVHWDIGLGILKILEFTLGLAPAKHHLLFVSAVASGKHFWVLQWGCRDRKEDLLAEVAILPRRSQRIVRQIWHPYPNPFEFNVQAFCNLPELGHSGVSQNSKGTDNCQC